ncbi:MAG: tRNA preQ1(34) S-adenosylmethionine ribosyltransferase-isomerase QueA [Treponema sp.]|nr:tRNA preQ1(34) S-adenosylmethionine ribosyltransferase-isomerase QueA [Treponema sp.]
MKTSDFDFDLPQNLIAQTPPAERGQSRLMVVDRKTGRREHRMVSDLPLLLDKETTLVFNNSRVRKARLFGISETTGARVEFLLLKKLDSITWKVLASRAKRRKPGSRYIFKQRTGTMVSEDVSKNSGLQPDGEGELVLVFDKPVDDTYLEKYGHVPLPPYIRRNDTSMDSDRYQTVYASNTGSAAAPTAGLHFTDELLAGLDAAGMEKLFITLHVGLGTFLPVRSENIEDHAMHEEEYSIDTETAKKIIRAGENKKLLAVGTTSLRTLESFGQTGSLGGSTSIFIYPGYEFRLVNMLFTNFHTPMSTLLMLVSAFAGDIPERKNEIYYGRDLILESYREAIKEGYRFFSYGDAMLIK